MGTGGHPCLLYGFRSRSQGLHIWGSGLWRRRGMRCLCPASHSDSSLARRTPHPPPHLCAQVSVTARTHAAASSPSSAHLHDHAEAAARTGSAADAAPATPQPAEPHHQQQGAEEVHLYLGIIDILQVGWRTRVAELT